MRKSYKTIQNCIREIFSGVWRCKQSRDEILLEHTDHPGTGNSQVKIPRDEIVRLNNTPISPEAGRQFAAFALEKIDPAKKIEVNFSSRKTIRRWGSVTMQNSKINIYRWSVWVMIHELGHALTPLSTVPGGRRDIHGKKFGSTTRTIYQLWQDFQKNL